MKKPTPMAALQRAIDIASSQAELARRLAKHTGNAKISQAHVWNWLNRDQEVPSEMAIPIEQVTLADDGGVLVQRGELRPDIYPVEKAAA